MTVLSATITPSDVLFSELFVTPPVRQSIRRPHQPEAACAWKVARASPFAERWRPMRRSAGAGHRAIASTEREELQPIWWCHLSYSHRYMCERWWNAGSLSISVHGGGAKLATPAP